MKKSSVDVCGLLESKIFLSKVLALQRFRLKKWNILTNAAQSSMARIVVFGIPLQFQWIWLAAPLRVSTSASEVFLCAWCPPGPWMILGDFNSLLSQDDKLNGSVVSMYETADFHHCCPDLGLYDLNYIGCHFTWSNGSVWSKLDRVLANPSWASLCRVAHVNFVCWNGFSYVFSLQKAQGVEASAQDSE
ncbi:hypothetical protein OIU76_028431 [Salix suchowensis]|nr:hypothetical protein OIU76_028431 [Salix suchowensis]